MNFNPITGGGGFVGSSAGYIPFAGADGSLADEAGLAFDSTTDQLRVAGSIRLVETAAAPTTAAGYGYLWVKNTSPSTLFFTDDTGADIDLVAGSPNNTLDNAYDQGGAGVGRTITVDSGPVQLNASVQDALGIALATTLDISAISITEDNVVRTSPMIELTRQALATGPMINLIPGGSVAALRVNGGKIDLSIAGDLGEYVYSSEDGNVDVVATITRLSGSLKLAELAAAPADTAAYGQLWVKDDAPNTPRFTDDAGTDGWLAYSLAAAAGNIGSINLQAIAGYGVVATQTAASSGTPVPALTVTGGAHTTLANASYYDVTINLGRTIEFLGDAESVTISAVHGVRVLAPTIAKNLANLAVSNAATLYIDAAPAGADITNAWALFIDAGNVRLDGALYSYGAVWVKNLFYIDETAAAGADVAGYGQWWVKNDTPCTPWFTGDTGVDYQLAALNVAQAWTAGQRDVSLALDLTEVTTTIDANARNQFHGVLSITTTALQTPSNIAAGQWFTIDIQQAAAGGKALTFVAAYDWGDAGSPDFTTLAANEYATIVCHVLPDGATIASSCSLNSSLIGTGTDNRIPRYDGTAKLQTSGWTIGDIDELSVTYTGATDAVAITLSTDLGSQALVVTEDNVVRTAPMIELTRQALATGDALAIDGSGSGNLVYLRSNAAQAQEGGSGLDVLLAGTARTSAGISVWESGTPVRSAALCDLSRSNAFATGAALNIAYAAVNDAIIVALSTGLGNQALVVTEDNVIRTAPMIELTRQANATGTGITINNSGSGIGISITSVGSGSSYFAAAAGAGSAYYASLSTVLNQSAFTVIEDNVVRTAPMIELTRQALATGVMVNLIPGAATAAALRVNGGKVDLSIAGDLKEMIYSAADNQVSIYTAGAEQMRWMYGASSTNLITSYSHMQFPDFWQLRFGTQSGGDASLSYQITQTPDSLVLGLSADSNSLIVCEQADIAYDFAHALQTNPTLFIQAADATDVAKWVGFCHDGTNGNITFGAGGLVLGVVAGGLFIKEVAAAGTDITAYGQLWIKSDTPNVLMFTNDAGTDYTVNVTPV